jgi:23S rRNA pseudouridine2605 synthase
MNTEGLLLLTNDGGLARALELPSTGWVRRYRVRALGRVTQDTLDGLKKGVTVEGVHYGPIEATLERQLESNCWLAVAIREGKNREVRRVMESIGLKVSRLIRVAFGPFELPDIAECDVKEVETAALKKALGPEIIKQAEADFDAPLEAATPFVPAKAGTQKRGAKRFGPTGSPSHSKRPTSGRPDVGARGRTGEMPDKDDRPETGRSKHKKRRRADRSGGPRPSRPRPK